MTRSKQSEKKMLNSPPNRRTGKKSTETAPVANSVQRRWSFKPAQAKTLPNNATSNGDVNVMHWLFSEHKKIPSPSQWLPSVKNIGESLTTNRTTAHLTTLKATSTPQDEHLPVLSATPDDCVDQHANTSTKENDAIVQRKISIKSIKSEANVRRRDMLQRRSTHGHRKKSAKGGVHNMVTDANADETKSVKASTRTSTSKRSNEVILREVNVFDLEGEMITRLISDPDYRPRTDDMPEESLDIYGRDVAAYVRQNHLMPRYRIQRIWSWINGVNCYIDYDPAFAWFSDL